MLNYEVQALEYLLLNVEYDPFTKKSCQPIEIPYLFSRLISLNILNNYCLNKQKLDQVFHMLFQTLIFGLMILIGINYSFINYNPLFLLLRKLITNFENDKNFNKENQLFQKLRLNNKK